MNEDRGVAMERVNPAGIPRTRESVADRQEPETAAGAVASRAREELDAVRREAGDVAETVKSEAKKHVDDARQQAAGFATSQKDALADHLSGIAGVVAKTANNLDDDPTIAGYAHDLAGGMNRLSKKMKDQDIDGLVGMAEDFSRRQPAAMLGLAALAGFVSARFLLASGERRESHKTAATHSPTAGDPLRR